MVVSILLAFVAYRIAVEFLGLAAIGIGLAIGFATWLILAERTKD